MMRYEHKTVPITGEELGNQCGGLTVKLNELLKKLAAQEVSP